MSSNNIEINVDKSNKGYIPLEDCIPLHLLPLGKKAVIKGLTSEGIMRRRMLDLGLVSDTVIEALQKSPSGDPTAYYIRGTVIALRSEEASKIMVAVK